MTNTRQDNPPMSIGMIGSGLIANLHASALVTLPHIRIDAILARRAAKDLQNQVIARGQGTAKLYTSITEMCRNVDAIAVLAPPFAQLEIVQEIALAKRSGARIRAIMIDKPLGRSHAEAIAICKAVKEVGLHTAYFENQIHMPSVQKQKHELALLQQTKGAPLLVRSAEEHAGPHSAWFWRPEQGGGGVLIDMGCHSIAVSWYLLTPAGRDLSFLKPKSVYCQTMQLKWNQAKWREDLNKRLGVSIVEPIGEDYTTGVIEFAYPNSTHTVYAQFTNSWMYDRPGLKLTIETLGAGYGFDIDTQRTTMQGFGYNCSAEGITPLFCDEGHTYGYTQEYQDAYLNFNESRDSLVDIGFGAEISRLVAACYQSANLGQKVDLF